ncbi:hypothetical protein K0017_01810 [Staphylococcus massiliensis]|uniref:hypothetical protein n=1 Tax=Staphylococcus massiliensis TaxID=555791 RepID=UPI001EE04651|nr:hypothetical protein [Staphylococcus massiliensis]MCG3401053.1 hypothetical protein [Staphylococcus massiliensis]
MRELNKKEKVLYGLTTLVIIARVVKGILRLFGVVNESNLLVTVTLTCMLIAQVAKSERISIIFNVLMIISGISLFIWGDII